MEERDLLLRRDVCDLIEESAIECSQSVSQHLLQVATSPKAHSCVQGVVERRFYPIHVRDFYSVINLILLQALILRRRLSEGTEENGKIPDENGETSQRKILRLEQEVKESKRRYKELFKINQQWAKDYAELNKKLQETITSEASPSSLIPSSSCGQCMQYAQELDSKTNLLKDLSLNYDKMKLIKSGLETRLEESEQEKEKIKDQYKAMSLQLQEVGGMNMAMRYKEERTELVDEIRRLREKVTVVERERASLQTQLNKFKYSLRKLVVESDCHPSNPYAPQNMHSSFGYTGPPKPMKNSQVFTDSTGCTRMYSGSRSNARYGVNPKQFAPLSVNVKKLPTGTGDHSVPQTPPGYLSRGDLFEDEDSEDESKCEARKTVNYLNIPSVHHSESSSQELPSPLNVPRPSSAPGSLFDSVSYPSCTQKATLHSPDEAVKNGFFSTYPKTIHHTHHHTSHPSIVHPVAPAAAIHHKLNGYEDFVQANYFKCPHCGAKFLQSQTNYDKWFDHVVECTK